MTHKESWQVWRNISDRIISNVGYKAGNPRGYLPLLLNLSEMASAQMGKYNTLHHGPANSYMFPRRFALAHVRRNPSLPNCIYPLGVMIDPLIGA